MSKVTGIDVSYCQTVVDYQKVKAAGINAVIIRAGYGREASQKDSQFEIHYKNAKSAGLNLGAYWYSYANSVADAIKEANACLACIKGKSFDMPIFYDLEDSSQTSYGKSQLTEFAKAFCDTIIKAGYRAGVYANLNWFNNYLDYDELYKKYPIWLAQYYTSNGKKCAIWQNSSSGKIDGINGNVDTNVIFDNSVIGSVPSITTSTDTSSSLKYSSAVLDWQKAINKGFDFEGANLEEDGLFGSASVSFAKSHVLYKGINNDYNCPTAVRWLQSKIGATQDGVFGNDTYNKLVAYQRNHGLVADGECGLKTYRKLLGM